ncbi:hypothetical protein [Rubrivivax sp. A210]|nr:hypothetical protein [Rubrivivax sp. A210]
MKQQRWSGQVTSKEAMNFNQFVGPPRPAFARLGLPLGAAA